MKKVYTQRANKPEERLLGQFYFNINVILDKLLIRKIAWEERFSFYCLK